MCCQELGPATRADSGSCSSYSCLCNELCQRVVEKHPIYYVMDSGGSAVGSRPSGMTFLRSETSGASAGNSRAADWNLPVMKLVATRETVVLHTGLPHVGWCFKVPGRGTPVQASGLTVWGFPPVRPTPALPPSALPHPPTLPPPPRPLPSPHPPALTSPHLPSPPEMLADSVFSWEALPDFSG